MSEAGYNLNKSTNLVTIQQHQHIFESKPILPYHAWFSYIYMGVL